MALNTSKCNHLMPLPFKGLNTKQRVTVLTEDGRQTSRDAQWSCPSMQ